MEKKSSIIKIEQE